MKKYIALSIVAATTMAFGSTASDLAAMKAEIAALKAEVATLKKGGDAAEIKKIKKTLSEVKAHDANDNIKWGVDLRTAMDSLSYTMASDSLFGNPVSKKRSNDSLLATRLLLNMAYAPDNKNIFKGVLAYNKAFGADFGGNGSGAMPRGWGMDTFDWVTNEALTDNNLKVKEAYWLYMGDSIGQSDTPWTVSFGRRPSTDGMLANLRNGDDEYKSPLAHMINVEFDGASAGVNLDSITGIPGSAVKLCLGQGSTNAAPMFSGATNYTDDENDLDDIKLAGLIITPYDDGQITSKIQIYRAWDLPGYSGSDMYAMITDAAHPTPTKMYQVGEIDGYAWSTLVNGIGEDGILADTKLFASVAMSKTNPNGDHGGMLGTTDSKTGTSYWVGAQVPVFDGKFGLEFNHGSKYWRPFTYGEDTMAGSKLAVRGDAWETYYIYPITQALSLEARYTYMDYDYTGSNNFFGADGTPMTMEEANAMDMGGMVVDKASDFMFNARYKF
ncbi:MAG: hypothetical protein QG564_1758 [Campylobacterota bacterium]|nr:hypothetical protein [Campylobacterota bacterium]